MMADVIVPSDLRGLQFKAQGGTLTDELSKHAKAVLREEKVKNKHTEKKAEMQKNQPQKGGNKKEQNAV